MGEGVWILTDCSILEINKALFPPLFFSKATPSLFHSAGEEKFMNWVDADTFPIKKNTRYIFLSFPFLFFIYIIEMKFKVFIEA